MNKNPSFPSVFEKFERRTADNCCDQTFCSIPVLSFCKSEINKSTIRFEKNFGCWFGDIGNWVKSLLFVYLNYLR